MDEAAHETPLMAAETPAPKKRGRRKMVAETQAESPMPEEHGGESSASDEFEAG
jgi:hypothetical protein